MRHDARSGLEILEQLGAQLQVDARKQVQRNHRRVRDIGFEQVLVQKTDLVRDLFLLRIRIRLGDDSVYRWEFERATEQLQVNVPGALVVDHGEIGLAAVRQGAGLFYVADPMVRQDLDQGVLRTVLDDWSPLGPGFHIYYSSRRQIPAALRLFIELVRELKPLGL